MRQLFRIVLILALCVPVSIKAQICGTTNIAEGKLVTVLNEWSNGPGSAAVDGNLSSAWFNHPDYTGDTNYLYVDLEQSYTFCRIKINWESDGRGKNYVAQTSTDAINWTTIFTRTNNSALTDSFSVIGTGRYVRIYMTEKVNFWANYTIKELQIYNYLSNFHPHVSLTAPVNNSTTVSGTNIKLTANASDPDGAITKVEFYQDTVNTGSMNAPGITLPSKYKWLLGVRNFNAGRVPLNHSELTAKNVSIKGINFEYNSWYYFAVSAGVVDYRFRDFSLKGKVRTPQYLYMVRMGLGRIEENYVILSAFKGQKQLFAASAGNTNNGISSINVTGFSLEGKLKLNHNVYALGEIAQSIAPDYRLNPPGKGKTVHLTDKISKGVSLKLYSYFPGTNSRLEGMYKYTGANFQSFSSFQTNAAVRSWSLKGEQLGVFHNNYKVWRITCNLPFIFFGDRRFLVA